MTRFVEATRTLLSLAITHPNGSSPSEAARLDNSMRSRIMARS